MQRIESSDNKKIKRLTSLKQKKVRLKENLFLMEGLKAVSEAVAEKAQIEIILLSDSFAQKNQDFCTMLDKSGIPVYVTRDYNVEKCSNLKSPQGIIAAVAKSENKLQEILKEGKPIVILDRINDPGNIGTIIRTADAFMFGGVLLLTGCADVYSPKTVQATMGSILRVACVETDASAIDEVRASGYGIYGMDLSGTDMSSQSFGDVPAAVIIGSESHGVCEAVLEKCDNRLRINMPGNAESLNAAVAAGIILHKIADSSNEQ